METLNQKRRRAGYARVAKMWARMRANPTEDRDMLALADAVKAAGLTIEEWYPIFGLPGTERLINFTLRATGPGRDILVYMKPSHHKSGRDRIRKRMIADREDYANQTGKAAILVDKGSTTSIQAEIELWLVLHLKGRINNENGNMPPQ